MIVNSGRDYKSLGSGSVPVYGTGGYLRSVDKSLSNVDAVGVGRKGTIDNPQFLRAPFWTVDTLFFLTVRDSEKFDLKFLFYLSACINWKKYDESTGVPSLSKRTIEKIKVFVPDVDEQIRIGQELQQLDNLIVANERQDKIAPTKLAQFCPFFLIHFEYFK
ncbi:type I restriction endonuclease subunit S [Lactobacillus sp. ZJLC3-7]|nr:type I restriction endonuclease subunit S [Levilactobacillus tujiorum]